MNVTKDISLSVQPNAAVYLQDSIQNFHQCVDVSGQTDFPHHGIKLLIFMTDLECGVPADIQNGRLVYLNETLIARRFKSVIEYQCDIGYVAVGRTDLMCDVDERWNGPPPRCDPVSVFQSSHISGSGIVDYTYRKQVHQ